MDGLRWARRGGYCIGVGAVGHRSCRIIAGKDKVGTLEGPCLGLDGSIGNGTVVADGLYESL
jgi:hypothetical protein